MTELCTCNKDAKGCLGRSTGQWLFFFLVHEELCFFDESFNRILVYPSLDCQFVCLTCHKNISLSLSLSLSLFLSLSQLRWMQNELTVEDVVREQTLKVSFLGRGIIGPFLFYERILILCSSFGR